MMYVVVLLRSIYDFVGVAGLAEGGVDVVCVDVGGKWAECIRKGEFSDFLPGLRESILRNQREGSLRFVENLKGVDRDRVLCILRGKPNPSAEEREIVEKVFHRELHHWPECDHRRQLRAQEPDDEELHHVGQRRNWLFPLREPDYRQLLGEIL